MTTDLSRWESDVVLSDGGTVHLRPVVPSDSEALLGLYSRLSDESLYLRFFSPVPAPTARQLEALTSLDYDRRFALCAVLAGELVAIGRFDRLADRPEAEVAFTVQDDQQGRGLGTILLENLAVVARELGIQRFVASTLAGNAQMLRVFADAGFTITRRLDGGIVDVSIELQPNPSTIAAQDAREHIAESHSIARVLAPTSIAVVGASHRPGTIGHGILRNLLVGDFNGPIYPVNPHATSVSGIRAYPTLDAIPDHVDLVVVAVPAAEVLDVVRASALKQARGLVVISAGFAELGADAAAAEREMVRLARSSGMRVIGPNCLGVANTNPAVRLNATFAPVPPATGRVGLASQSGGLAIDILARVGQMGLGISTFVSMGNKADVSGNDLIQYWEDDPDTDVILLYLESFGNPRKFSRLARRVARQKPIIAVKSGRTVAGARGTSSHTAALAVPDVAVDALFRQAGVIRVDTLEQLLDVATVVLHQPLPAGRQVAVVTNGGGPGILAADACAAAGLEVPELRPETQRSLRAFVSPDAGVANPVDLVASATSDQFEEALRTLLADEEIDAALVVFVPPLVTRAEAVEAAVRRAAAGATKPVVACFLGHTPGLLHGEPSGRPVPTFPFPEGAAAALGRAADLSDWRRRPEGHVPALDRVDLPAARRLVADTLSSRPDGTWLDLPAARDLLACVGATVVPTVPVADADAAARAVEQLGSPVVLKARSGTIVHKSDVGAVQLSLRTADEARVAFDAMAARLGAEMGGGAVQPMLDPGVELIVGVTRDPQFGPLVLLGMGGAHAELLHDTALRLVPLTDVDARELVRSLRGSPLLFGYRNAPPAAVGAVEDLLLRVAALADAVPEIAELDCNPVIVSPDAATAVDVKVRVAPAPPAAPTGLRRLRDPA